MEVLGIARSSAWSCRGCSPACSSPSCSTAWSASSASPAATSSTSILQGGTPGAYLASFTALAQLPDLYIGEIKALMFGLIAALVGVLQGPDAPAAARRASATR